ncbi:MAG: hypothetical protein U0836_05330 [Pirellulales bacterium]
MLRFLARSLLFLVALAGATFATIRSGSGLSAALFFGAALGAVVFALIAAIFGRGRQRTFARGFSVAACLYLLVACATPHSARWEAPGAVSRAALWLFVQLQRTREPELHLILATLEVAVALVWGWLGGHVALLTVYRRPVDSDVQISSMRP